MASLDDVWTLLHTRKVPNRVCRAVRIRIEDRHGRPYPYQLRAWIRLLESYPEWNESEFHMPDWALDELRLQEDLPGDTWTTSGLNQTQGPQRETR